jgi:sialidase-1
VTQLATFYFDGTSVSSWAGELSTQDLFSWGNGGTSTDGIANYRFVQFEVFESVLMLEGSPVVSEEGPTTDNYTVSLTQAPTADVMVTISPDLAGADDIDLGAGPGNPITLTFTTNDWTPRTVSITAVDDTLEEGTQQVTLNHVTSSTDPAFNGQSKLLIVTIEDNDQLFIVHDIFVAGQEGPLTAPYYRIPSIIQAADGSLLAFIQGRFNTGDPGRDAGGIEMHTKCSTDNGLTWSDLMVPLSNPDPNGSTWDYNAWNPVVIQGTGQPTAPLGFFFTRWPDTVRTTESFWMTTSDGGLTWTTPVDITSQVQEPTWSAADAGPGRAIQLQWQTDPSRNGRLVFTGKRTTDAIAAVSFYSDDLGSTFTHGLESTGPSGGGNENEVVELTNGDLLMDARKQGATHRHRWLSSDGGETWTWYDTSDFNITTVDCSLIRYSARRSGHDRDRLLFSGPLGSPIYSGSGRYNMAVWTSYDEGKTFINPVHIQSGFGGYSALEKLNDDSIGLFYEATSNTRMRFVRFDLNYLEGQRHSTELAQYDGFRNVIDLQRGGMGWTGSWTDGADFTNVVAAEFGGSSVLFDGFPFQTEDGRVDLTAGQSTERVLAAPVDLNYNSTTYVSLVVSQALDTSADDAVDEALRIELQDSDTVPHVSFGVNSDESFLLQRTGGATSTAADALSRSGIYFLVAKIVSQNDANPTNYDQLFLKVFESGVDTIPHSDSGLGWTLVGTTNANSDGLVDRIALVGQSAVTFSVDEVRIGSSFEAVAAITCAEQVNFLQSDINEDCYVNLLDLIIMANDWLKCTDPADSLNCDF